MELSSVHMLFDRRDEATIVLSLRSVDQEMRSRQVQRRVKLTRKMLKTEGVDIAPMHAQNSKDQKHRDPGENRTTSKLAGAAPDGGDRDHGEGRDIAEIDRHRVRKLVQRRPSQHRRA